MLGLKARCMTQMQTEAAQMDALGDNTKLMIYAGRGADEKKHRHDA